MLAFYSESITFDVGALAPSQQGDLLVTALLIEVRASPSVGGGGRKKRTEPCGKAEGESWKQEQKERAGGSRKEARVLCSG